MPDGASGTIATRASVYTTSDDLFDTNATNDEVEVRTEIGGVPISPEQGGAGGAV